MLFSAHPVCSAEILDVLGLLISLASQLGRRLAVHTGRSRHSAYPHQRSAPTSSASFGSTSDTQCLEQKRAGTWAHAGLNDLAISAGIAGLVIIEFNKFAHNGTHFVSAHAILGLITYILLLIQATIGFTQYFVPQLYGGEENAKKLYKYHRVGGYVIFIVMLSTVAAATQTDYNKNVLQIQLWAVLAAIVITLVGIVPRIRLAKFGWLAGQ